APRFVRRRRLRPRRRRGHRRRKFSDQPDTDGLVRRLGEPSDHGAGQLAVTVRWRTSAPGALAAAALWVATTAAGVAHSASQAAQTAPPAPIASDAEVKVACGVRHS